MHTTSANRSTPEENLSGTERLEASSVSSEQIEPLRWNGWGYEDTQFSISENGEIYLAGQRYDCAGELPHFKSWIESDIGIDVKQVAPSAPPPTSFPEPIKNEAWVEAIKGNYLKLSFDGMDRLSHSHGHTAQEIFYLRYGWPKFMRIVDAVVYPGSHDHVVAIVKACCQHNVTIIPYGGGTSVTYGLQPDSADPRMCISLAMSNMTQIKWVNRENMTACIEAGIRGVVLNKRLEEMGLTLGHEPDSAEFSTLGGWIATRASGMKKNNYGNIEDLLVSAKFVTPLGVLERNSPVPRVSSGPDLTHVILGSEGTLGVVTEAIMKVRPIPPVRVFGAIVFHCFDDGIKFMREVAYHRVQPASVRLVDNDQFKFSHALKPATPGILNAVMDTVKKQYITKYHKIDVNALSACTLVFEGTADQVKKQQAVIYNIAKKYSGVKADASSGIRGYNLTFMIAYLRDFAFQLGLISESFETSVPWSECSILCKRVKERVRKTSRALKVPGEPFFSCRVTQTYDVGACIYFYIAIQFQGLSDPVHTFSEIEHSARDEILKCGGSISHHHGIGKHRKEFMKDVLGEPNLNVLRGIKDTIDPANIFASGNLIDPAKGKGNGSHQKKHKAKL